MEREHVETAPGAEEELLHARISTRRGKLALCTRKMNELKVFLEEDVDLQKVNELFAVFIQTVNEFSDVHKLVQNLLSEEEKETDNINWYEPKIENLHQFMNEVEAWKNQHLAQSHITPFGQHF